MRLADIINRIADITDFNAETTSYREEVQETVNSVIEDLYTSAPFSFAQKQVEVQVLEDLEDDAASITTVGSTIYDGLLVHPSSSSYLGVQYEGSFMWLSGTSDTRDSGMFVIDRSDAEQTDIYVSRMFNQPQTEWHSNTDPISMTIRQLLVDLPEDCSQVLAVERIEGTEAFELLPTTRKAQDLHNPAVGGLPSEWSIATHWQAGLNVQELTPGPFTVSAEDAEGAAQWPAGTYRFYMAYRLHGKTGPLSDYQELELDGEQAPAFTTPDTTASGRFGIRKVFFVQLYEDVGGTFEEYAIRNLSAVASVTENLQTDGFYEFIVDDDENGDVLYPDALGCSLDFLTQLPRAPENSGFYHRLYLHPHPTDGCTLRIRYMFRPQKLMNDQDSLAAPPDVARYIQFRTAEELLLSHGRDASAGFWGRKADRELQMLRNKYLNQRPAAMVKGNAFGKPQRVSPHTNVKYVG